MSLPKNPIRRAGLAFSTALKILRNDPTGAAGAIGAIFPSVARNAPRRGTPELIQAYNELPWLHAVVHRIAEGYAATTWRVYGTRRRQDAGKLQRFFRERHLQRAVGWRHRHTAMRALRAKGVELVEIEDHPLPHLIEMANPFHVGPAARKLDSVYFDLAGETFAVMERAEAGPMTGMPVALWPIPPHWVQDTPRPERPSFRVKLPGRGGEWDVPETEMLWLLDPDPFHPYSRGSGAGRALADELDTDEFASKHLKHFFFNRARPDFVAWVKPAVGQDVVDESELRRLQVKWENEHRGFFRSWRPHFTNRDLQIHEFQGQDLQKQQAIQLREYERDTIVQVLGVPPEILGILQNSNRATIDAADYLFARWVLEPRLEMRRAFYQEQLVPLFDDRAIIDYDSPVPDDRTFLLDVSKAHPYAFNVDELRAMAEQEPLEDDQGRVRPVPISVTFTEDLRDLASLDSGPSDPEAGDEAGDADDDKGLLDVARVSGFLKHSTRLLKGAGEPTEYEVIHRIADRLEPRVRAVFLRAVRAAKNNIDLAALEAAVASGQIEAALAALPIDEIRDALDDSTRGLGTILRKALSASAQAARRDLETRLGISLTFDAENPAATAWVQRHVGERITEIHEANRQAIRNVIADAFQRGGHPHETARLIRSHIGLHEQARRRAARFQAALEADGVAGNTLQARMARFTDALLRERAVTIARTETLDGANAGQRLLWEDASRRGDLRRDDWRQEWVVTPDDALDTRICEPMPYLEANKAVPIGGMFTTGDGRQIAGPTAHPRCRCTVRLVRVTT